jgi:hypothetical protein
VAEQAVVIITVAVILLAMVFSFSLAGSHHRRIGCTSWKIRSNGIFEAHTDAGTIRFRRKDIEIIEPSFEDGSAPVSVRVGNLQRMVWIDFPDEAQALRFVLLTEREFFARNFNRMPDLS